MNKKGDIGESITWFVAVIVILFVLVLFLLATGAITVGKKINLLESKNEIGKYDLGNLKVGDALFSYMNSQYILRERTVAVKDIFAQSSENHKAEDFNAPNLDEYTKKFFDDVFGEGNWRFLFYAWQFNNFEAGASKCESEWSDYTFYIGTRRAQLCGVIK